MLRQRDEETVLDLINTRNGIGSLTIKKVKMKERKFTYIICLIQKIFS